MWETSDTIGLLSCIIGTALFFIPYRGYTPTEIMSIAVIVWLIGGSGVLIMGIIAIARHSKIGIGGIIIGAYFIISGILYTILIIPTIIW